MSTTNILDLNNRIDELSESYPADKVILSDGVTSVKEKLDIIGAIYSATISSGTDIAITGTIQNLPKGKYIVIATTGEATATVTPFFILKDSNNVRWGSVLNNGRYWNITAVVEIESTTNLIFAYAGGSPVTTAAGTLKAVRIA